MRPCLLGLFLLLNVFLYASSSNNLTDKKIKPDPTNKKNLDFVLHVKKAIGTIKIDGVIDEPDWAVAEKADKFHLVFPVDSGYPKSPSEVVMTYDDKAFYLGITFFDTVPGKRIAESFRHDFMFNNNDNFLSFFDTFLDQTNGFSFGVSASGAKWDGVQSDGAAMNLNWDCKWESKTAQYPDRWVTEMRIPFRSIRFRSGTDRWYANFSRLDLKTNEKSSWAPVPRQFPTASLAYTGVVQWDNPLPKSKMMFSIIPYIFGGVSKDFEAKTDTKFKKDFGFDAKVGLSASMNLDLTYNPNFSQAEVDQQVTNLDRFELFFPEKRQFFLENSDLFANYGNKALTPFFSRRIGLDAPVTAGARLSGKLGNNWRLGLLDMQTEKTGSQLARNFMVASIQRKVFARSNVGMIFVNKEYLNEPVNQQYNRVLGLDYNLASSNNKWIGKLFYHRSFVAGNPDKQFAQGASLAYNSRRVKAGFSQASVGENYSAETGYVRRTGYNMLSPEFSFLWVPNKKVVTHGILSMANYYFDADFNKIDHELTAMYKIEFANRNVLTGGIKDYYILLKEDFDPTHISNKKLSKGTDYAYRVGFVDFASDTRKMLHYGGTFSKGGFFNGNITSFEGQATYRYQPYLNMSVKFSYNDIDLPGGFDRARFWLVGPKLDLTLSDKVFFTSFVQYNEQIKNMNINMRLQWRYQPVSDLFVVYTDNYFTDNWNSRNRALVLKLSYWFN